MTQIKQDVLKVLSTVEIEGSFKESGTMVNTVMIKLVKNE